MLVRLLLAIMIALVLGAATTGVATDVATGVMTDGVGLVQGEVGDPAGDLDDAQVVTSAEVRAPDRRAECRGAGRGWLPEPPCHHAVFRPPRVAAV